MNLDREYEKFRGGPTEAKSERLHITINKSGVIFINANAYRKIGKPTGVYLYFNRKLDRIVLEPTSARLAEAFPVKESLGAYKVYASPFCKHFGIHIEGVMKFARPDISEKGSLILDLSNIVKVTLPGRKGRGTANK
jgi:hypothetical protein